MQERRALARVARRSITTAPLRSALIVALVALLIGVGASVGIVARSVEVVFDDEMNAEFGSGTIAVTFEARPANLIDEGYIPLAEPDGVARWHAAFEQAGGIESVRDAFDGSSLVTKRGQVTRTTSADGPFGQPGRQTVTRTSTVWGVDMEHPVAEGLLELVDGRFPTANDEIAVTPRVAERSDYQLGQQILMGDTPFALVGLVAVPSRRFTDPWLVTFLGFERVEVVPESLQYTVRADVAPNDVVQLLHDVEQRVGHPVVATYRERELGRDTDGGFVVTTTERRLPEERGKAIALFVFPVFLTLVFGTVLVLVGAVIFAVSIRRRTHELGQLVSVGADGQHLRRVLRYEAGWLGLAGAVLGVCLAITFATISVEAGWFIEVGDRYFTEARVELRDVVGPAVVGFLSVLVAARWPAVQLEEWSPSAAVSGILPASSTVSMRARWGVLCLAIPMALFVVSLFVSWSIPVASNVVLRLLVLLLVFVFGVALILSFLGGVLILANAALAAVARRADRLPLVPRMVIRSAGRQRGRSAAVVGVMAVVIGVPILIGSSLSQPWAGAMTGSASGSDGDGAVRYSITAVDERRSGSSDFENRVLFVQPTERTFFTSRGFNSQSVAGLMAVQPHLLDAAEESFGSVKAVELKQVSGSVVWEPRPGNRYQAGSATLYVATPELVELFDFDVDTITALEQGVVLDVSGQDWIVDGEMRFGSNRTASIDVVEGPQIVVGRDVFLVSPLQAIEFGNTVTGVGSVYVTDEPIDIGERASFVDAANEIWAGVHDGISPTALGSATEQTAFDVEVDTEGSRDSSLSVLVLISIAVAAIVGFLIAALSAVELDREVGLMIAIGAVPAIRREFLALQTLYQSMLAAIIAVPLAVIMYNAASMGDGGTLNSVVIPWTVIGLVAIVMPLSVAALVGILFRSGTPAVSRRVA